MLFFGTLSPTYTPKSPTTLSFLLSLILLPSPVSTFLLNLRRRPHSSISPPPPPTAVAGLSHLSLFFPSHHLSLNVPLLFFSPLLPSLTSLLSKSLAAPRSLHSFFSSSRFHSASVHHSAFFSTPFHFQTYSLHTQQRSFSLFPMQPSFTASSPLSPLSSIPTFLFLSLKLSSNLFFPLGCLYFLKLYHFSHFPSTSSFTPWGNSATFIWGIGLMVNLPIIGDGNTDTEICHMSPSSYHDPRWDIIILSIYMTDGSVFILRKLTFTEIEEKKVTCGVCLNKARYCIAVVFTILSIYEPNVK